MDPVLQLVVGLELTAVGSLIALLAYFYRLLIRRFDIVEKEMREKVSLAEVRMLFNDKIESVKVEYTTLSRRLDEMKESQILLSAKIDRILEICSHLRTD